MYGFICQLFSGEIQLEYMTRLLRLLLQELLLIQIRMSTEPPYNVFVADLEVYP